MVKENFNKKVLLSFFFSLIFAGIIYSLIIKIQHIKFFSHMIISHYLTQCRIIIFFLPLSIFIYGFKNLHKFFDLEKWASLLKEKYFLISIFMITFISTNLISLFIYHHIPIEDDVISFFQAKIFAKFKRWATPPLYPEFFPAEIVTKDGKWFGMMPPGHSLFLAMGILLDIPWIISPLMGSISIIVFYFLIKEIYDESIAKVGALLLSLSPTFLFVSSSMVSQNSSYFFSLLSIFFIIKSIKRKNIKFILFSGVTLGIAFLCRPQLPLCFFIILNIFLIYQIRELKYLLIFSISFLPFLGFQLLDNYILTGNPLHYGYHLYLSPEYHGLGFGEEKGSITYGIRGHTLLKGFINLFYNLFVLSLHLFGFPLISLLFIPFSLKKIDKYETLFTILSLSAFIFWFLYWFHGVTGLGPKYYYEILPFLVILSARGIYKIKINIKPFVGLLLLFNILIYIPNHIRIFRLWGCKIDVYNKIKEENIHNAIVFVKDLPQEIPFSTLLSRHNYFSLFFRNEVDIHKSDIIYVWDLGEKNKKLLKIYPNRKAYIIEFKEIKTFYIKKLK